MASSGAMHDAEIDRLRIHSLVEDAARWETLIQEEIARARHDQATRQLLESLYYDEDRARAFERFRGGTELSRILQLLDTFGIGRDQTICEIGGGAGWLAWALYTAGYTSLELLEPNACFNTGTGYLRSREDATGLRICNNLDAWYASDKTYDVILTHNCVHHFRGIAHAAAAVRQKVNRDGRWLMLREWFAADAHELYQQLATHPYCQRYGVFEFPYPASHYVESLELAGFSLEAVVPLGYANNTLAAYVLDGGNWLNRLCTASYDVLLRRAPRMTRLLYGAELFGNRYLATPQLLFTRPQALLFRRRPL
jgi:hypothetical protein